MAGLHIDPASIAKAREAGYNDDEIVSFLSTKSPEQFKAAQDAGYNSKDILNHFESQQPSGLYAGFTKGLSDEIQGIGETGKQFLGTDNANTNAQAAKIAPKDYHADAIVPEGGHWYDPRTYNFSAIPQTIAEMAPSIATSLIAGRTAARLAGPKAGLAAGVASMLIPTLGRSAKEDAAIRTGNADAEPEFQDKARAVLTGAAQAVPAAIGLGRFIPGVSKAADVGATGTMAAVKRALATGGTEAAAGGAQDVIGQVGSTIGTDKGLTVDPNRTMSNAIASGVGGTALSAPHVVSAAARTHATRQFTGENQAASEAVANRIAAANEGTDIGTKAEPVRVATENIKTELNDTVSDISKRQDLGEEATSALQRAAQGRALTDTDFEHIQKAVGDDPAADRVMQLARQAHVATLLTKQGRIHGDDFIGGAAGFAAQKIRALANPTAAISATGLGYLTGGGQALAGFLGQHSPAALAAIGGGYAGLRAIDAITGARAPAQRFVDRFANPDSGVRPNINIPPVPPPLDLSQGPWGQRPPGSSVPQVEAPNNEPSLRQTLRANVGIDTGLDKVVRNLANAKRKSMVNDAMPLLRQLAEQQGPNAKPVDLPDNFTQMLGGRPEPTVAAPEATLAPEAPLDPLNLPADMVKRAKQIAKYGYTVQKMRERNMQQNAAANPAVGIPPPGMAQAPEPPVIAKISKKLNGTVQAQQAAAQPDNYSPIATEKLWRRMLSDEDVARKELSSYRPEIREKYFENVVDNRAAKRDLVHEFAFEASDADAKIAGTMYHQLDHISRRAVARSAIAHYAAQMSPEGAAALRAKFTPSKMQELWTKE